MERNRNPLQSVRVLAVAFALTGTTAVPSSIQAEEEVVEAYDAETTEVEEDAGTLDERLGMQRADASAAIRSYVRESIEVVSQAHDQSSSEFAVWYRDFKHQLESEEQSVAKIIAQEAFTLAIARIFPVPDPDTLAEHLAPEIEALGELVRRAATTSVAAAEAGQPPASDIDTFLAQLVAQDERYQTELSTVPAAFAEANPELMEVAIDSFLLNRVGYDDVTVPEETRELLEAAGVPRPELATAETVTANVLASFVEAAMNAEPQHDFHRTPDLAMTVALMAINPVANLDRVCEIEQGWNPAMMHEECR